MNLEIRALQATDAEAYFALRLEALTLEPLAFGRSAADFRVRSLESVRAQLIAPESLTLGAFLDSQPVGIATLLRENGEKVRHKAAIVGVYVTASARGKGIARILLTRLIEHARLLEGLEQVQLSVSTTQQAARALYSSLGFARFGHELRALKLGQQYVDEEHMVLHLHPIE